jgi:hypothetical protein
VNNNPIRYRDPTGKCIEDGCAIEAGAVIGFAGGVANQAFSDYQTGAAGRRSLAGNIATYTAAGVGGAIVGGGTAAAGAGAAALSLSKLLTFGTVSGTAGLLTGANDAIGNYASGRPTSPTDYSALGVDTTVAALTAGTLEHLPSYLVCRVLFLSP